MCRENKKDMDPPALVVYVHNFCLHRKTITRLTGVTHFLAFIFHLRISTYSHADLRYQYFYLLLVSLTKSRKYSKKVFSFKTNSRKKKLSEKFVKKMDEIRLTFYNRHGLFSHEICASLFLIVLVFSILSRHIHDK